MNPGRSCLGADMITTPSELPIPPGIAHYLHSLPRLLWEASLYTLCATSKINASSPFQHKRRLDEPCGAPAPSDECVL